MSLDKPFMGKAELRLLLEHECSSAPDPVLLRTKYFGFSVTFVDLDLDFGTSVGSRRAGLL